MPTLGSKPIPMSALRGSSPLPCGLDTEAVIVGLQHEGRHVRLEAAMRRGRRPHPRVLHDLHAVHAGPQVAREGHADLSVARLLRFRLGPADAHPGDLAAQLPAHEEQRLAREDGLVRTRLLDMIRSMVGWRNGTA